MVRFRMGADRPCHAQRCADPGAAVGRDPVAASAVTIGRAAARLRAERHARNAAGRIAAAIHALPAQRRARAARTAPAGRRTARSASA
jgi:hypothetical protein